MENNREKFFYLIGIINSFQRDRLDNIYQRTLCESPRSDREEVFYQYSLVLSKHLRAIELEYRARGREERVTVAELKEVDQASFDTCNKINEFARLLGHDYVTFCQHVTFFDVQQTAKYD